MHGARESAALSISLFILIFFLSVTHVQHNPAAAATHRDTHALDVSGAPHCWLVARATPHHHHHQHHLIAGLRKQTAHNIIGKCTTCQRCMTRPVALETSSHQAAVGCCCCSLIPSKRMMSVCERGKGWGEGGGVDTGCFSQHKKKKQGYEIEFIKLRHC